MSREIWTLDCETDPFLRGRVPSPFLWGVFTGADYHQFDAIEKVIEFLYDKPVIVYAHNGGKFDFHYMTDWLERGSEITIINGRIVKFKIGHCEFRDSWNILPVPLGAYQKTVIDYSIMERSERRKKGNWKLICDYLRDDCRFLHQLVSEFAARYGNRLTLAGASMKQWEKMSHQKAPQSDSAFYDALFPFYYGGRVECFERGDIVTDFRVVDINSAYPFAMLQAHPLGLRHRDIKGAGIKTVAADSFYTVECRSRGVFPMRQDDGKLWFPADNEVRQFNITGWELQAAIDTNAAPGLSIARRVQFQECEHFSGYINHFYNLRRAAKLAGNKAETLFAKLLMNSLYGKFAANPRKYGRFRLVDPCAMTSTPGMEPAGMIGPHGLVTRKLMDEEQRFYNIATAASITGFVRAYLWRAMRQCGGLLYCDTDSIAARDTHSLPKGGDLGQWNIEGEFSRACIAGKKMYAFKRYGKLEAGIDRWKVASKGVRLSWREIAAVANGAEIPYHSEVPTYSVFKSPSFTPRLIRATS